MKCITSALSALLVARRPAAWSYYYYTAHCLLDLFRAACSYSARAALPPRRRRCLQGLIDLGIHLGQRVDIARVPPAAPPPQLPAGIYVFRDILRAAC